MCEKYIIVPLYYPYDLHDYFEGCVIGGTGAFARVLRRCVVAGDWDPRLRSIRHAAVKLLLEIAGITPQIR